MPETRIRRPIRLRMTIRRVRLEKPWCNGIRCAIHRQARRARFRVDRRTRRARSLNVMASTLCQDLSASAVMELLTPLFLEAVAHAVEGLDHVEALVHGLELLP